MATVRSLARQTGFSVATISRALSGTTTVSPKTRAVIEAAIRKSGYQRRPVGRTRVRQRQVLGMYAAKRMRPQVMHDHAYNQVYDHLDYLLAGRGYELVRIDTYPGSADGLGDDRRTRRRILDEELSGMLIYGDLADNRMLDYLDSRLLPVLRLNRHRCVPADGGFVAIDQAAGARLAATHLLGLGHRRILLVLPMGNAGSEVNQERLAGFHETLAAHGLASDPALEVRPVTATMGYGYEAVGAWLAQGGRCTAAFCNNDEVAIGAMRAFREAGLRVPEDVAIVGYDDLPAAAFCTPALTTIRQDFAELARHAVDGLLAQLEDPALPPRRILLAPSLVVRASCKAAS